MAQGITVEVRNADQWNRVLSRYDLKRHPRFTQRALNDLALRAVAWAKKNRFVAGGRFKRYGSGGKLGDAPARPGILTSRTGRFRDSIAVQRATPRESSWGPQVRYALTHEFGRFPIPPRPVVAPTQDYIAENSETFVRAAWERYVKAQV